MAACAPARTFFARWRLGAGAWMIGRAYAYGLGAEGERGVSEGARFLAASELDATMALAGVRERQRDHGG